MALYLGSSEKLKINLDSNAYCMNIFSALPTITEVILSSSDDYLLNDFNGLYLISKESE